MNLGRTIEKYFSLLDAGEAESAAAMFEPDGRVDAPWENNIAPAEFISKHLSSAPTRRHEILDVLISSAGQSAAVHFEYSSKSEGAEANPTFVGCDHFRFGANGKIEVLSVYCHAKQDDGQPKS